MFARSRPPPGPCRGHAPTAEALVFLEEQGRREARLCPAHPAVACAVGRYLNAWHDRFMAMNAVGFRLDDDPMARRTACTKLTIAGTEYTLTPQVVKGRAGQGPVEYAMTLRGGGRQWQVRLYEARPLAETEAGVSIGAGFCDRRPAGRWPRSPSRPPSRPPPFSLLAASPRPVSEPDRQ
jgi:hypothetical protein